MRCNVATGLALFVLALAVSGELSAQSDGPIPMPPPKFDVKLQENLRIPMRDGVRLSTDLHTPVATTQRLPAILIRTPYGKAPERAAESAARMFAAQGYAVAVQEMRGTFESEGVFQLGAGDVTDADDTIKWIVAQPWSSKRVGMYGCSLPGATQVKAAQSLNKNLVAILPQATSTASGSLDDRYAHVFWKGGALEMESITWMHDWGSKLPVRAAPSQVNWNEVLRTLPLLTMDTRAGSPPTDWRDSLNHLPADPWWNQLDYLSDRSQVDVPALFINSWYDHGVAGTFEQFNLFRHHSRSARARDNQFVIISPTTHCGSETLTTQNTIIGDRPLGDARFDFYGVYLKWFDHWLRGSGKGQFKMPRVQYFVMGLGRWKTAEQWPPAGVQLTKFYLRGNGRANSRVGDGVLSVQTPGGSEPADRFTYDPATPVPSAAPLGINISGFDQREIEMRNDVLVYSTPVLEQGIEVTGPLQAVLHVSSSAKDTDFTAKLIDVYPDGRAFAVQEGILRARYRQGFDRQATMERGKVYELTVKMEATSNYFDRGHRIRLEISSSNFPRYDRNLNTGGRQFDETEWVVAGNEVHHSAQHASYLLLPIAPQEQH